MICDSLEGTDRVVSGGQTTAREIYQQPVLWLDTFRRIREKTWQGWVERTGVLCGAGTSAYAAAAIQSAWPASRAVSTTDLLTDSRALKSADFLFSIARSGDSPESIGVVDLAHRDFPQLAQLAITCNEQGQLAQDQQVDVLLLDARTNDRSLVMTSSFSNLVLAGLALSHTELIEANLTPICSRVEDQMAGLNALAKAVAFGRPSRAVVLASSPLFPWAQESCLKILEMTAGQIAAMPETYLGLRHGPMSFLSSQTLVLCLISSDPRRQRYELDLIREIKTKQLGQIIGIMPENFSGEDIDISVPAAAPGMPDELRTPFEIIFPQLLAYNLSLVLGLDPDNPSPTGIINRVVTGIRVY
jgi:tagatose-6-phosphate ketose/aldose isomerase